VATGRKKAATKAKSTGRGGSTGRSGRGSSAVVAARRGGPSVWTIAAIAVIVLLVGGLIAYFVTRPSTQAAQPQGVQTFSNLSRNHVTGTVTYPQTPPVGGNHSAVWLNCGTYTSPVANENAVHSMEHGAVWITYQPTLPATGVTALQHAVAGHSYVVLSPYSGLPSPVVASAWGVQLKLATASDPRLAQFIAYYEQGPQTPEHGSACTGGTGTPQ
jgi:hypothetical protein